MIKKIKPSSPDIYLGKTIGDNTLARIAHVNQLADQINANVSVASYKVYTALLTRTGATAPSAVVLENTLGVITFAYNNTGSYSVVSANLFTLNKTHVLIQKQGNGAFGNTLGIIILTNNNIIIGQNTSSGSNDTDWGFPVCIEIRVYN